MKLLIIVLNLITLNNKINLIIINLIFFTINSYKTGKMSVDSCGECIELVITLKCFLYHICNAVPKF